MASLSARLLRNTALVLLLVSGAALGAYQAAVHWCADTLFEREVRENADKVEAGLRYDAQGRPQRVVFSAERQLVYDALPHDMIYRVLDLKGRVVLASDKAAGPLVPPGRSFDPARDVFEASPDGLALRVVTRRLNGRPYYVQSARSERFQQSLQNNDERTLRQVALVTVAAAMLAFTFAVWRTFRRALRPLLEVSAAAAAITPERLNARLLAKDVPSEIAPLIAAFNAALDRLARGFQIQQEFLATAAHELKTPLTLMRGQLELEGLADREVLLKDVDRMGRQVQQLLNLAECSERKNYVFDHLDANAAVDEVASHLQRLATPRRIQIDVAHSTIPVLLRADRSALFVLLKNLLENAIQHSPPDSDIHAIVSRGRIVIRDQGGGIPASDLPMLFQRFWRGAHRRDEGAGLGLAICQEIASAHGWHLSARNAPGGAEFTVITP